MGKNEENNTYAGFEHAFDKDISFSSKPSIILAGRKII